MITLNWSANSIEPGQTAQMCMATGVALYWFAMANHFWIQQDKDYSNPKSFNLEILICSNKCEKSPSHKK